VDAFFLKGGDLAAASAIDDADLGVTVDILHEPNAPRAQDAAIAIEHERRPEVDVGLDALAVEHAPGKLHPAVSGPERVGEILQRALAPFVADRAIERVIDEQELENSRARVRHVRCLGLHDHPVDADRRAGGLQLRHLLDLHDADAARPVDPELGVIAVVRH
jgi:hypothetical protein